jgi:hypothetical protein
MDLQAILWSFSHWQKGHWQGGLWLRRWSEKLTRCCPKSLPQIQHYMTTTDQITVSGPLCIFLLIDWELVK